MSGRRCARRAPCGSRLPSGVRSGGDVQRCARSCRARAASAGRPGQDRQRNARAMRCIRAWSSDRVERRHVVIVSFSPNARDAHPRGEGGVAVRGERFVAPDAARTGLARKPGHAVRPGDVVERGADEAPVAGVELADDVEIPGHVAEVAKTCQPVWNIDPVRAPNAPDCDKGRATVRPSARPGAGRGAIGGTSGGSPQPGAHRGLAGAWLPPSRRGPQGRTRRGCAARSFGLRPPGGLARPSAPSGRLGRFGH